MLGTICTVVPAKDLQSKAHQEASCLLVTRHSADISGVRNLHLILTNVEKPNGVPIKCGAFLLLFFFLIMILYDY